MNPEELHEARKALAELMATLNYGIGRNVFLYGVEWSVLHGSNSDDENLRVLYDAGAVYDKGGRAALLAKYPMPAGSEAPVTATEQ